MDGEQALTFVRQRKQFADGDFQRNRNQQAVLQGIADKLISADTLTDPRKLRDTIDAVSPYLTTDDGLSATAMVELGLSLRSVRSGDLYYLAVPHAGPDTTSGGASVAATREGTTDEPRAGPRPHEMGTSSAPDARTCSPAPPAPVVIAWRTPHGTRAREDLYDHRRPRRGSGRQQADHRPVGSGLR